MKKLLLLAVVVTGFAFTSTAQTKVIQTITIKTPTVQCQECKDRIEEYLKKTDGVQKVNVDYKKKITKVTFISDRTNAEEIKTAIANCGYDADDVTANEESYKKLPKCCKKTEDGGGGKH
jgi:periplasmic mercuric ion binding protein